MKDIVYYMSETGNTKMLATEIFAAIPDQEKDIANLHEVSEIRDADTYYIGFRVVKGTADIEVLNLLSDLHGKRVALFGTCGMGTNEEYYKQIEEKISVFISEDNQYLGCFLCQGKMPIQVRKRYEDMLSADNQEQIKKMLRNFDEALLHPDKRDLTKAGEFVRKCCAKV